MKAKAISNVNLNATSLGNKPATDYFLSRVATIESEFVDSTDYTIDNEFYKNYQSGMYWIQRSGSREAFLNFNLSSGATSAIQFYGATRSGNHSELRYRTTVDGNRICGPWQKFVFTTDLDNYVTMEDLEKILSKEQMSQLNNSIQNRLTSSESESTI